MRGTRYPCSVRRTCGQARKHLIGQPFSAFTSCPHSAIGSRAPIGRRDLVLGAPLQVVPPTLKVRALSVPPQNPSRFIPSLLPSHRPSFFTSSVSPCSPPLPPLPARSSWSSLSLEAIESEIENRSRQKISQKRQKSTFLFLVPFPTVLSISSFHHHGPLSRPSNFWIRFLGHHNPKKRGFDDEASSSSVLDEPGKHTTLHLIHCTIALHFAPYWFSSYKESSTNI